MLVVHMTIVGLAKHSRLCDDDKCQLQIIEYVVHIIIEDGLGNCESST